jgi:siderophore synthetase component
MQVLEENVTESFLSDNNKIHLQTNLLKSYISKVNRQSIRQLLIAFLRERILEYHYHNENLIFKLPRLNSVICVNRVQLNSLTRFKKFEAVFFFDHGKEATKLITDPMHLLEIVQSELDTVFAIDQWQKVAKEVGNHIQNAILIAFQKDKVKNEYNNYAQNRTSGLSGVLKNNTNLSDYSFKFEQLSFGGHPHHPFAKTKVGFSIEDVISYTTEFQPKVAILLAAVRKANMSIETTQRDLIFPDWFSQHYPAAWKRWTLALNKKKLDPRDYLPFPVHPWQLDNIVRNLFREHIDANDVILLDNVVIEASPTSSFRTLVPTENECAPYIKLPIGIYASGVFRSLSINSIKSTPKITHIMRHILTKEASLKERLSILPEVCGLYLKSVQDDKAQHFTAIFRENIIYYLAKNEVAVVVAALFEKLSINNASLFIELLQLAGCLDYQNALAYFSKYVDLVLGSYLDLYLIYGIALEGHQQNTLAVFENGQIKRFIARDFDGIRIDADSLKQHDFGIDIALLSPPFVTSDKIIVRNQILHTVYQLHLGELVLLLAAYFSCEEKIFWKIVRDKTEERFSILKDKMDIARWESEYEAILQADWPIKALLRMRLEKQYKIIFSHISNPFTS